MQVVGNYKVARSQDPVNNLIGFGILMFAFRGSLYRVIKRWWFADYYNCFKLRLHKVSPQPSVLFNNKG